ncbi:MAG: transposase [Deltaproteobacteria bacterium]|nr:transposase [Deltaproteobacteria bacterium]
MAMARRSRIHFPGAFYHVIVRGNGGQDIFREDDDYRLYLRFLKEYKERYQFSLYAYALMTNHAHLLVQVGDVPLARIMQVVQFRYAKRFNFRYGKEGHEDFYDIKDQRFLGEEEFIRDVRLALNERKSDKDEISIERLTTTVSNILGIERILFYSATRGREGALGRAVVGYLGRKICGYENSEIASHFRRDPATLSCGIRSVEKRMAKEESFVKLIKKLEDMLVQGQDEYQIIKA